MISYKKPAFWIIIALVAACIVAAVCLLINPKADKADKADKQEQPKSITSTMKTSQYKVTDLFYCNITFGFSETADNAPQYFITEGKLMWNIPNEGEEFKSSWTEIGKLEDTEISKSDFKAMITNEEWFNTDFSDFYGRIASVKRAENKLFPVKQFFYVLQLKDSSVALCRGFYNDDGAPFIRWIQKLDEVDVSAVGGADNPNVVSEPSSLFNATVLEVTGSSILVRPEDGSAELKTADKIFVSLSKLNADALPEIKAGDKISISYDGTIAESYPAQINNVYAVYTLDIRDNIISQTTVNGSIIGRCYTFKSSVESQPAPTIILSENDNSFQFTYSALSSYIAIGKYKLTENLLTLRTDDGLKTYVFKVAGNTFIFDASASSEIPKYAYSSGANAECPVTDGAIFE